MSKRLVAMARLLSDATYRERIQFRMDRLTDKTDASGCWLWTGSKSYRGYGQLTLVCKIDGETQTVSATAHRVAFVLAKGDLGDKHVLHMCDKPLCINPDHLVAGTHKENMRDMARKGRASGGTVGPRKHTEAEALLVLDLIRSGHTTREIHERTQMDAAFIRNVASGRTWHTVTGLTKRIPIPRKTGPRRPAQTTMKIQWEILGVILERGQQSTGVLASLIGADRQRVYQACALLEDRGLLLRKGLGVAESGIPIEWTLANGRARKVAAPSWAAPVPRGRNALIQANNRLARGEEP